MSNCPNGVALPISTLTRRVIEVTTHSLFDAELRAIQRQAEALRAEAKARHLLAQRMEDPNRSIAS